MSSWVVLLSEFDVEFVPQKAIKGQALADQLTEAPLPGTEPLQFSFPDEDILHIDIAPAWTLFFDGSCNLHGSGA
ncbi:hypothetical protein KI387_000280, partial [Taxus chinensis]